MSNLTKLDTFLHKTHSKVHLIQRYKGLTWCRFIISLSKITHQMWCDHSLSQREQWAVEVEEEAGGGVWDGMWIKFGI